MVTSLQSYMRSRPLISFSLLILSLIGGFCVILPIYETPLRTIRGNEGWLAVLAANWRLGYGLYPGAQEFIVGNYPPLSYLPYVIFDYLLGDSIIAGRWLSWLMFGAIIILCYQIIFNLTRSATSAVVTAILLFATFAVWYGGNLGVADPQLTGHAVQLIGLLFLARRPRDYQSIAISTCFLIIGGLVKPNLFGFPIGLALYLLWISRRLFFIWAASSITAIAMITIAMVLWFGSDVLWPNLLLGRTYSLQVFLSNLKLILTIAVPLTFCGLFYRSLASTDGGRLILCLLCGSLVEYMIAAPAAGTAFNIGYDLALAACLGIGIILKSMESRLAGPSLNVATVFFVCEVVRVVVSVIPQVSERVPSQENLAKLRSSNRQAETIIVMLAEVKGKAVCFPMAYCYWAGHYDRIDLSLQPMRFFRPPRDLAPTLQEIEQRQFAAIVIGSTDHPLLRVVEQYYQPNLPITVQGSIIWVPKPAEDR